MQRTVRAADFRAVKIVSAAKNFYDIRNCITLYRPIPVIARRKF